MDLDAHPMSLKSIYSRIISTQFCIKIKNLIYTGFIF